MLNPFAALPIVQRLHVSQRLSRSDALTDAAPRRPHLRQLPAACLNIHQGTILFPNAPVLSRMPCNRHLVVVGQLQLNVIAMSVGVYDQLRLAHVQTTAILIQSGKAVLDKSPVFPGLPILNGEAQQFSRSHRFHFASYFSNGQYFVAVWMAVGLPLFSIAHFVLNGNVEDIVVHPNDHRLVVDAFSWMTYDDVFLQMDWVLGEAR